MFKQELIITIVGQVNTGKTSLINKVLGANYGSVGPTPGWTKEVEFYKYDRDVLIVDTPGLEDMNKDISKKTINFCDSSDILIYMFNASLGVTDNQRDSFKQLYHASRPTLALLNKIDVEKNWEAVLKHAISVLEFTNFLGISCEYEWNTKKVVNWLISVISTSKKRLFCEKILRPIIVGEIKKSYKNPAIAIAVKSVLEQLPLSEWFPENLYDIGKIENLVINKLKKGK